MIELKRQFKHKGYIFGTVFVDGVEKFYCIEKYFNHLPEGEYQVNVANQSPSSTFVKMLVSGTKKVGSLNPEDDMFFGNELRYCYIDDIFEWEQPKENILIDLQNDTLLVIGKPKTVSKEIIFDQPYFKTVTRKTKYDRYE